MFILIWTTLLFSVSGNNSIALTQMPSGKINDDNNSTLNLSAETGKTVTPTVARQVSSTVTASVEPTNTTAVGSVNSSVTGNRFTTREINTLEDFFNMLLDNVKQPQVIVAFCAGIFLSAFICCLTRACHRKKPKTSENMVETLEMVTTEALPLMDGGQSLENGGAPAVAVEGAEAEAKEVEYSDIDVYRLSRKNPGEAEDVQTTTETEYAEIKREAVEQEEEGEEEEDGKQEDGKQEGEAVEGEKPKEAEEDEEEQQVVEEELLVFEDCEATGE